MLLSAAEKRDGRFLYLNETSAECQKLAWYGLRGDGMYSMAMDLGLSVVANGSKMTLHFPAMNSWIYLMGADDEAGVRKALGLAYHEVWWDEAQKIPPKLESVIKSVLMPTLLDYGGRLRLTGTPVPNMSGLFYNVTRTDGDALPNWSVHRWNMLDNPFFGRTEQQPNGTWKVLDKFGRAISPPFLIKEQTETLVMEERRRGGVLDLQELLGGPEAAPIDSPLMRREGFGEWVHEDALYVYDIHRVTADDRAYAEHRVTPTTVRVARAHGEELVIEDVLLRDFPDLEAAIADLPGGHEYFYALAADIGYRDPFAFCLVAWSLKDPCLYEVACWGRSELDQPTQAAILRYICDRVNVGVVAADAGGSTLPTVKGWSEEWQARYGIPIDEMEKTNKAQAIAMMNADIVRKHYRFRREGPLLRQLQRVQWLPIRSGTGRLVEDPSIANDLCDSALYAHRRSFAHRFHPEAPKPEPGTPEFIAAKEEKLLESIEDNLEVVTW